MDEKLLEYLLGGKRFVELDLKGNKYVIDRLIFSGAVVVMLIFFVALFLFYGSDRQYHYHYECHNSQGFCANQFYMSFPHCEEMWPGACSEKYVKDGFEWGERQPELVKSFGAILGVLIALAFILNHFIHNRGKKFPLAEDGDEL